MKYNSLSEIEKDNKLKVKYLPRFYWLRTLAIYPPSLFIFFALFGLVYLLNNDMLLTYYAIPFAILFFLATLWFKMTRRYVLKQLFAAEDSFLACVATVIKEEDKSVAAIFTTDSKRHNKYFIQNLAKRLSEDDFINSDLLQDIESKAKAKPIKLEGEDILLSDNAYLVYFNKADIRKKRAGWNAEESFPVFYVNEKTVSVINFKNAEKI